MADDERRRRGKEIFTQVTQMDAFEPADAFTAVTLDQVFGGVWSRSRLSFRERRLLCLGALMAQGMDSELRTHMAGALRSGDVGSEDMLEVIIHLTHYAGWPKGAAMHRKLQELCQELGLDPPTGF